MSRMVSGPSLRMRAMTLRKSSFFTELNQLEGDCLWRFMSGRKKRMSCAGT